MAKDIKKSEAKKRKLTSKGKVFVRRVIAGLLMFTALIVAALPEDSSGVASAHNSVVGEELDYSYDRELPRNSDLSDVESANLDPTSQTKYYSYQILPVGSNLQLQWKYEFYDASIGGLTGAVISDYNDGQYIENLNLEDTIITGYEYVTINEFNDYVTNTINAKTWTLDYRPDQNGTDGSSYTEVMRYFPDAYNEYVDKYNSAVNEYRNLIGDPTWAPASASDTALLNLGSYYVFNGSNMSDENKRLFYCDHNQSRKGGIPNTGSRPLKGCTLVKVNNLCISNASITFKTYDRDSGTYVPLTTDNEFYIVVKADDTATGDFEQGETYSYMYNGDKPVKGIANDAFYNTKLVDNLYVGGTIKYVGDRAFKDSFLKSVNFQSVIYIGNQVFMDCDSLATANLGSSTIVGREAFYGCDMLSEIIVPQDVDYIGFGAFANCPVLTNVDFTGNQGCVISDYAFFNDPALSTVTFNDSYVYSLGKAVFAMDAGSGTGCSMTSFTFPKQLGQYVSPADNTSTPTVYTYDGASSYTSKLGDYTFANRYNLRDVTMPVDFGSSTTVETVPVRTFDMCPDLSVVFFDSTVNNNADYEPELFEDVTNPDFYVFGPQLTTIVGPDGERYSLPRRSTWEAHTAASQYVPYVYNDGTTDHYEVGVNGFRYELSVNNSDRTASMIRCEFIDPTSATVNNLHVPGSVAGYSIKSMQDGCFDGVKDYIDVLYIDDNSIEEVGDGVFSDCDELTKVVLGNSVKKLGNNAFADNSKLEWVEIGPNIESIGDECFQNCPLLTTVDFDSPSNYGTLTNIGNNAFYTGSTSGTNFYGDIVNGYLPFDYAMGPNKVNSDSVRICYNSTVPSNYTQCHDAGIPVLKEYSVILDEDSGLYTLIDYPRYVDLDPAIRSKFETGGASLNDSEMAQLNATLYLDIPYAVESVDIANFLSDNSTNPNKKNWIYVPGSPIDSINSNTKKDVYSNEFITAIGGSNASVKYANDGGYTPGLFSGEMSDSTELNAMDGNTDGEQLAKGNDWILAVNMPGVVYVPDHCFDSCERLQSVIIGDYCDSIGEAAFQGCRELNAIGTSNNPKYTFDNYILYENLGGGQYQLNTCLPARGVNNRVPNEIWVDSDNDPLLLNTASIKEGAFSMCKGITKADLSDTTLSDIPQRCFDGCDKLTEIILPDTVRSIAKKAFNTGSGTLDITIPCDTNISDEAFNPKDNVTIRTYKECDITAHYKPVGYDSIYIKYIDSDYVITYLNDDLTIYTRITVPAGYNSAPPDTNPAPKLKAHLGYQFSYWEYDNVNTYKNVTENRQAIAIFVAPTPSGNTPSGNTPSGNTPGGGNSGGSSGGRTPSSNSASQNSATQYRVTVENGAGSGTYQAGRVVTITAYAPADGKVFDTWTTSNTDIGFSNPKNTSTTFIMPNHDVKVTATFKNANSSGSNNTSASGNNANNNNNNGNNGNNGNNNNNNGNGQTEVRVTSDAIDNNNKNLASATVAGSTDNFVVKITDSAYASAQVEQALKNRYGNDLSDIRYVAFDISLYDETGTYLIENSNDLAVTITLPIPDDLVSYAGNNRAAAVINGELDDKTVKFTTIDGVPCMTFTATHFSPYTIYVDTNNLLASNVDLSPKTGIDIAPKWFLASGLALFSCALFLWKDKKKVQIS